MKIKKITKVGKRVGWTSLFAGAITIAKLCGIAVTGPTGLLIFGTYAAGVLGTKAIDVYLGHKKDVSKK